MGPPLVQLGSFNTPLAKKYGPRGTAKVLLLFHILGGWVAQAGHQLPWSLGSDF